MDGSEQLVYWLIGLFCVVIGVIFGVLVSQRRSQSVIGLVEEKLASQERNITSALDEKLQRNSDSVVANIGKNQESTTKTLGDLRQQLGEITGHQRKITELSGNVADLHTVLTSSQAAGNFGEWQLAEILHALPAQAYSMQKTLSNDKIVDCLIDLPFPPGPIAIDAKFPAAKFIEIQEQHTKQDQKAARGRFRTAVSKEVNNIQDKYIIAGETSEFALLFTPSEAIFVELQAHHTELILEAQRKHVFIVSPSTLMAMVTSIRAILRDTEIHQQAREIQRKLGAIQTHIEGILDAAAKFKKNMDLGQRHLTTVVTRSESASSAIEEARSVQIESSQDPQQIAAN